MSFQVPFKCLSLVIHSEIKTVKFLSFQRVGTNIFNETFFCIFLALFVTETFTRISVNDYYPLPLDLSQIKYARYIRDKDSKKKLTCN